MRVLISGSVSFSKKMDISSSPDRRQVAAPPFRSAFSMLCVILGFSIQPSSVDRISLRFSSSSPIYAIYVTWDKSCNREISEKTEAGKIFTCFHILKHFPFLISTILAKTCSTFVRCSLNNFGIKASIVFAFQPQ
jgi:hypothetical protein